MKCLCGCEKETKIGNKYVHGHHRKGKVSGFKGKTHSENSKIKISKFHKNKKLSEKHKKKISKSMKNIIFTKEHKNNLSKAQKGKKYKEKIKKKMSESKKGKNYGMCGENHYNWKGGITNNPYCTSWNILTKELKEYDNYECQNPQCEKLSKRITSHHIDYNKQNCYPDNIITLCNSCNVKANKDREWWRAYYIEIKRKQL